MDAAECFSAMLSHHLRKAFPQHHQTRDGHGATEQGSHVHEISSTQESIAELVSGESIARQFSETVAHQLQPHELAALIAFFHNDRHSLSAKNDHTVDLSKRLELFYTAETALSSQDRTFLAEPSGSENAELGLILHVQTRDVCAAAFWDLDSPTIQLLQGKGLRSSMLFGYDWHWRAESARDRHKLQCPATGWPKGVRELHDDLSTDIARALPLPFLIVAGSCARKSYAKSISSSAKLIELSIAPSDGTVIIWLEFSAGGHSLSRFTVFVNHPASMFYAKTKNLRPSMVCLDAGLNLVLWLLGISYDAVYFLKQGSICHYTRWGPHGLERGLKGAPLAELHAYRRRELEGNKVLSLSDYPDEFIAWAQSYLGESPSSILEQDRSLVAVIQSRISAKISKSNQRKARDTTQPQISEKDCNDPEVQRFSIGGTSITNGSDKSPLATAVPRQPPGGLSFTTEQIETVLIWLSGVPGSIDGANEEMAPFAHLSPHELLSMEYELAVAEVLYMRRFHNLNEAITAEDREKKVSRMKNALRVKSHGIRKRYQVSTRPRTAKNVSDAKPSSAETPAKLKQAEVSKGAIKRPDGASNTAAPRRSLQDWRAALLGGASFPCMTPNSRLRIRLPFLLNVNVPSDAHPEEVFLQCHLAQAGNEHKSYFALDTTSGDKARRLGIHIQYSVQNMAPGTTQSSWITVSGMENARKARALVDLLDNQDSEGQNNAQSRLVNAKPDSSRGDAHSYSCPQESGSAVQMGNSQDQRGVHALESRYRYVKGMSTHTISVRPQDLHTGRGRQSFKANVMGNSRTDHEAV